MSGQHTPGPWVVFEHAFQGPFVVSEARAVAQVVHGGLMPMTPEEEANARLLAAAPALLEALKDAVDFIVDIGSTIAAEASVDEMVADFRAAITSATGEA